MVIVKYVGYVNGGMWTGWKRGEAAMNVREYNEISGNGSSRWSIKDLEVFLPKAQLYN